jgi:hypothetical protein
MTNKLIVLMQKQHMKGVNVKILLAPVQMLQLLQVVDYSWLSVFF